jgi:hypothetical protein
MLGIANVLTTADAGAVKNHRKLMLDSLLSHGEDSTGFLTF